MAPVRVALVGLSIGALTGALTVLGVSPSAAAPAVGMWLTTPDRSRLLAAQPASALGPADPGLPTITVDAGRTFQAMEGFGGSMTDSSARLIAASARRDTIMRDLFDPEAGIGLSYLRQPIGASDFVAGPHYTYQDLPAGQTDYGMSRFSIDHDRGQILPLLRQARQLNPQVRIMASPWSPPAWMKTSGSLVGGQLKDDDRVYQAYAQYFVRFVTEYAAAGVPVDAVSVQNEPQNRHPKQYPGTDLRPEHQARLIRVLGPALAAAGLRTRILAFDHNWALHPDDQNPADPPDPDYARTVLADPQARRYIAGVAYHCYYGDPSAQSELRNAYPAMGIYFTECSGVRSAQPERTFQDTLRWQTRNLTIGATRHWARTVVGWNLALDPSGGPHNGGCDTCTGVVTVDGGTVARNAEYYVLGHASKFVRPGAVRVESNVPGNLGNVAFRNPDGSLVLLVLNDVDAGEARFTVRTGAQAFSATLPAGAVATFLQPAGGGTDVQAPAAPANLAATGRTASSVSLAWTGSTDNVGVTGYDVYRGGTRAVMVTGTAAVVEGLSAGTTYSFTVTAHDAAGNVSAASNAITVTTSADGGGGGTRTGPITGIGGKCVDVAGAATANGTAVQLYTCNGTGAQQWTAGTDASLRALGKCADIAGGATADGAKVQLYDCNGTGAQVWQAQGNGTLRNPQSNKCLDATDNSSADGTRLQIWECFGGANQVWRLPA